MTHRDRAKEPTTDEELREVTIGAPTEVNGQILLVDSDPEWPILFAREAAKIRAALGERALLIEHAGSTSVPGLVAKPILDIIVAVADSGDESTYVPALEAAGYQLRIREPEWEEHRLLQGSHPDVNLHVFTVGSREITRMLTLRDWLRANEADRALYAVTKRELASRTWKYVQNYADAKTTVIAEIMARAEAARATAAADRPRTGTPEGADPRRLVVLGLSGWVADRNARAMQGARALAAHFGQRLGCEVMHLGEPGAASHLPWDRALERARPHLEKVAEAVSMALEARQRALIFANRCAASVATIAAALARLPELRVVWLDAHADFNTPQTSSTGYLGGMVLSALSGLWDSGLGAGLGPGRIVLAGSRDVDEAEYRLMEERQVLRVSRSNGQVDLDAVVQRVAGHPVWIHVDLDVLEPGYVPTEYRVPNGFTPNDVRWLLEAVARHGELVALEVAEFEYEAGTFEAHARTIEHMIGGVLGITAPHG